MKELSIEQKAEAYDKALERAKRMFSEKELNYLFPELKESEDEKIRNEIILYIGSKDIDLSTHNRWLSWLEKQGKPKHKFIIGDIISNNNVIYRVDNIVKNCIGQDCYFLVNIESEKNGTRYHKLHYSDGNTRNSGEITWLCEQVDTKFEKKFVVDFKAEDWYVSKVDGKIYNLTYNPTPKFHIGDWVISTLPGIKYPHLITDIKNGYYIFGEDDDHVHIASNDNILKLWTIKDAKNGDVLSNGEMIVIFKHFVEPSYRQHIVAYIGLDTIGGIQVTDEDWELGIDKAKPATKEQCDTLFAKMKEAGYTFDFEKKKLKKISQEYPLTPDECINPWSEEDEKMRNNLIRLLIRLSANTQTNSTTPNYSYPNEIDWLKSLKQRHAWKPSDAQMQALKEACDKHVEPDGLDPLYTLYEQLKTLTK